MTQKIADLRILVVSRANCTQIQAKASKRDLFFEYFWSCFFKAGFWSNCWQLVHCLCCGLGFMCLAFVLLHQREWRDSNATVIDLRCVLDYIITVCKLYLQPIAFSTRNVVFLWGCTQIPVSCVSNSVEDFMIIRGVPPQSSRLSYLFCRFTAVSLQIKPPAHNHQ